MENIEQILQKLVAVNLPPIESDKVQHLIKHAFEAGKADQSDPLEGYSNLTAAIEAGEPIDYEKLEGRFAKCVHPELPNPFPIGNLQVHHRSELRTPTGWREVIDSLGSVRRHVLLHSWWGEFDWSLWVEGDIPMRRKTADQLEVGTYFRGEIPGYVEGEAYVGGEEFSIGKLVHRAPSMIESTVPASEWIVLEEYGTSPKPEGE